jgi:hypothetical protein
MAETRLRLSTDLEASATPGSIVVTNASNEQGYLAPGANETLLQIVSGVPTYVAPTVALGIYYGNYEVTGVLGTLEYTIPYTATTISHAQVTQVKNTLGGGYFADYIIEVVSTVGIKITYDVQPPVGQLIKFNYLIIK